MTHAADVLILGGGVAGCVLAARLSADPARHVTLVEAGPDYGASPYGWPGSLIDAARLPRDHFWERSVPLPRFRGRVLGGSSAVNGGWHTWGSAADHRTWQALAGDAFASSTLGPFRDAAITAMGLTAVPDADITVWGKSALAGAGRLGYDLVDMAAPGPPGCGTPLVNVTDGTRRNVALSYLTAEVRTRSNLTIVAHALVDRLLVTGDRATGARVITATGPHELTAAEVVLSAGALGSPLILQRSGVGDPDRLRTVGVDPLINLPGVGSNLSDQPGVFVPLQSSAALDVELTEHEAAAPLYSTRVLVRVASTHAPPDGWDLHLLPVAGRPLFGNLPVGRYEAGISAQLMSPRSRGAVHISATEPSAVPQIDPAFLSDLDGVDLAVLREGLALACELAQTPDLRHRWTGSLNGLHHSDSELRASLSCYWHPVGTCAAGTNDRPEAVVDPELRVRGLANVRVVDASVLPSAPAANTQLTVLALAEWAADLLASGLSSELLPNAPRKAQS